ncbi:MAG: hypothetical protein Q9209_006815 [Squamulea sp. 1 TL-2023]
MESIPHAFDPGDKGSGIIAGNIVVVVLATIAVGLRIVSRRMQRLSLEADDYLIFVALPFGWAMCICTLIAVQHGLGRHIGTVPPEQLVTEGQAFFASELIWAASIPIIKISILLLYIRIFGRLRYFRLLAYIIGIFSICWSVMVILVLSFQCRPVQYIWDKSVKGTCINVPLFFILGSAPNVFTDFVLLVLPMPAVWNLHTTKAQKISLTAIFLLGSLYVNLNLSSNAPFGPLTNALAYMGRTCVISLVRFVQLITNATMDATWSLGIVSVWSTAEPNLGIVSACLPTMKPLLRRVIPQGRTRNAGSNKRSGSGDSGPKKISATESIGSSGFNKLKRGRGHQQFRELDDDDDIVDNLQMGGPTGTQTRITSSDAGEENLGIPMNVIEVKTNMDWQHASREEFRS